MNDLDIPNLNADKVRVLTEENTKVFQLRMGIIPQLENPYMVLSELGKPIGSAVLDFVQEGIVVDLFLDHHTPERLDFETNPERMGIRLQMKFENNVLQGNVKVQQNE